MPPRKRAGDLTGNQSQELQDKHAKELKSKQSKLTMIQQEAEEAKQEPVDLTGNSKRTTGEGDSKVTIKNAKRRVRALADIEATIGAGNQYNLEEGRTYDLPSDVADHLQEKGLVWA